MAKKKCPQCKERVDKDAEYCECGYFFPAEPVLQAAPVQPTASTANTATPNPVLLNNQHYGSSQNTNYEANNDAEAAAKAKKQKAVWASVAGIAAIIIIRVIIRLVFASF